MKGYKLTFPDVGVYEVRDAPFELRGCLWNGKCKIAGNAVVLPGFTDTKSVIFEVRETHTTLEITDSGKKQTFWMTHCHFPGNTCGYNWYATVSEENIEFRATSVYFRLPGASGNPYWLKIHGRTFESSTSCIAGAKLKLLAPYMAALIFDVADSLEQKKFPAKGWIQISYRSNYPFRIYDENGDFLDGSAVPSDSKYHYYVALRDEANNRIIAQNANIERTTMTGASLSSVNNIVPAFFASDACDADFIGELDIFFGYCSDLPFQGALDFSANVYPIYHIPKPRPVE